MSLIRCKQLSKSYGGKQVLSEVDFILEAGSPIAVVGPNGAGKTTLFSILSGYIKPSSGTVMIMGEPVGSPKLHGVLSALPQDAQLDPDSSILSQLRLFAELQGIKGKAAKNEAMRVLELVDLTKAAKAKPKSLSHGMSKRVSIAQALIGSPKLVLLDEPTAGLDPANARRIRQIVDELSEHTTFVISSHNLDELEKLCDQVIYLEEGKLKQSLSIQSAKEIDYLTLVMKKVDMASVHQALLGLTNITKVTQSTEHQFIIEYPTQVNFSLEQQLFNLLAQNQWQYKSLLKGRTLEDTLFSS
ncbi:MULTISPECIES: ABC transporter ATP-binding protein [Pseudomonadati]|uniref:ABC transporter ATP-binding protein n=1 Tax=Shewanella aestuarii TaxID=1028752 RepID=A0ABT0KXZ9_9GAMM|nr:ABC transporter ATP-binding protein [Shewanella aestuarii]MCL1116254.1 ABC transporter ATP-binding protein [Shewanella aestuarii]GGN71216.1 ABC transporter [Shewanella aestuarii]